MNGRSVARLRPSRLHYRESYEWPIAFRYRMQLDSSPARSAYFSNGTLLPNCPAGVHGAFLRTIRTIYANLSPRASRYAFSRPLQRVRGPASTIRQPSWPLFDDSHVEKQTPGIASEMGKMNQACEQPPLEDNKKSKEAIASWGALFNFTDRAHLIVLIPALILSAVSGILPAALAIFLGRYFDGLANFGAGTISDHELVQKVQINTYGLIAIGGATWLMKGGFFTLWLIFGEMQAKNVRDILFQCLLQKDLEWFEMRSTGVGSLLSRSQTYAVRPGLVGNADPISDRSENYKSGPHNHWASASITSFRQSHLWVYASSIRGKSR